MKLGKTKLSIKALMRRNWMDTEMRVRLNDTKAQQYAYEMTEGAVFPLPVVFMDHDEVCHIGDGFHRVFASAINKATEVEVDLRNGGYRAAFLWNIEANKNQRGMPFSQGDLERCITTLLQDQETRNWTQTKIAEMVGCSIGYVSTVVKKTKASRPTIIVDSNGISRGRAVNREREVVKDRKEKSLQMFQNGHSKNEIRKALGVARSAVQRYIQDAMAEANLITCPHCHGKGMVQKGD